MRNLVSILFLSPLFLIACAKNNNQIPKSLSSSYDGIWDGYAHIPARTLYIKAEIKNGVVSGFIEDSANVTVSGFYEDRKVTGYIDSENNLIIKPVPIRAQFDRLGQGFKIIFETNSMSPNRIEGTCYVVQVSQAPKYDWFVAKPATGK